MTDAVRPFVMIVENEGTTMLGLVGEGDNLTVVKLPTERVEHLADAVDEYLHRVYGRAVRQSIIEEIVAALDLTDVDEIKGHLTGILDSVGWYD